MMITAKRKETLKKVDLIQLIPNSPSIQSKEYIGVCTSDGIEILRISDISYCKSESNYSQIHLRDGQKILASKTLKIVEASLDQTRFLRVHHSFLVCIADIIKVYKEEVILKDGISIPVSRTRRSMLMNRLQLSTNFI